MPLPRPLRARLLVPALIAASAIAGSAIGLAPARAAPNQAGPDAELRRMLATRVDVQRRATGVVVGVVSPAGRRVVAYGTRGVADKRPVTVDTVFDVGSITKLFTAILLADLAARSEVGLDDPVARYLPPSVAVPAGATRAITLADLATHTAGLPLRPTNLVGTDPENKYAGYTEALLYEFLGGFSLPREPGSGYEYSNVGYGVLGHALARRLGRSYEAAIQARITGPLGLRDTRIALTPAMRARRAIGYTGELAPAPAWDFGALEGAGALRSTARDLMALLEAQLGLRATALQRALAATTQTRRPGGMAPAEQIALGWNVQKAGDHEIFWKNGSVGGYRTFVGFDAQARVGVVALANAQTAVGVDDIALHLLDPASPVDLEAPVVHKAITLAPDILERYVGRYRFSDTDTLTVTRDGAQLFGLSPGADRYPLHAEAERRFFLDGIEAQVSFEVPVGASRATAAIWHQGGQDQRGARVEPAP